MRNCTAHQNTTPSRMSEVIAATGNLEARVEAKRRLQETSAAALWLTRQPAEQLERRIPEDPPLYSNAGQSGSLSDITLDEGAREIRRRANSLLTRITKHSASSLGSSSAS